MSDFKAGYGCTDVTPPPGCAMHGYYLERYAKGILDRLQACAIVLSAGGKSIVLISVDNGGFKKQVAERFRRAVSKSTGIPEDRIFISATHSHTAPTTVYPEFFETDEKPIKQYIDFLTEKIIEASVSALKDIKPAKIAFAVGKAPDRIAYIRRYRMKDGSTATCPPINDPNIVAPIGQLDQRVNLLRIDRENAHGIVILNYGLHADTVNGNLLSADWPGWTRKTVEKALDGVKCVCIMGAQGDVGSTNVHPLPGDMNDTEISFDNEMKSPGMARFVGRALAGTVLQVYDKAAYFDVDEMETAEKVLLVKANVPEKSRLPLARKYKELYESGRSDLIPFKGMQLTTVVAEALRMCNMENGPETFELPMAGLKLGRVALISIPGEPFTDIGVRIKATPGWDMIMPCALTNGYEGYFPVASAFDEGGYEAKTSPYTASVADDIVNCAKNILAELNKK